MINTIVVAATVAMEISQGGSSEENKRQGNTEDEGEEVRHVAAKGEGRRSRQRRRALLDLHYLVVCM